MARLLCAFPTISSRHQLVILKILALVIPHHGSYGKSSFIVTGANLYNSLPSDLVNSRQSLLDFKKKVKRFIYDRLLLAECDYFYFY